MPVGLLLSDGIDSQSVRAALEAAGAPLHAYTFRLAGGQRTAADVPGVSTTTIELSPAEYRGGMARTCALQSEPVGDLAALATAAVIARSRDRATVFLCGHGADEILGGYRLSQERFRLAALWRFGRLPLGFVRRGLDRHLRGDEPLAVRARRFLDGPAREAPAAARFLIQRPVRSPELAQLFGDAWPAGERHLAAVDRLYGDCPPAATDLERMQEVMVRSFLSEDILPYADSCAMAAAAELRMPYLDRDLVEFVCALPDGERVGRLPGRVNTKLPLRRWARGRLPEEVRARGKEPFAVGAFAEVFPDIEMARGPILGSRAVRRAMPGVEAWFASRAAGWPARADGVVWSLLSLALWAEATGAI